MIKNIFYALVFAAIVVPSWQIGSIMMEKQSVTYMLEKHANSIKIENMREENIKKTLKKSLELKGLPTEFTVEMLEGRGKIRISYHYNGAATVFGYTYYQTAETLSGETTD